MGGLDNLVSPVNMLFANITHLLRRVTASISTGLTTDRMGDFPGALFILLPAGLALSPWLPLSLTLWEGGSVLPEVYVFF